MGFHNCDSDEPHKLMFSFFFPYLQTFHEARQAEITSGEERVSHEKILLDDAIANAKKGEANIKEEYLLKIERMNADTEREVQRIKDEMNYEIEKMNADAKKTAA